MKGSAVRLARALRRAVAHYIGDDCALLAAAIAFYSLLSLAPALYLVAAALGPLLTGENVSRRIVEQAAAFLPPEALPTLTVVEESLRVSGSLIVVALPGLLWIATHAFSALQRALNVAFARRQSPIAFWHGRLKGVLALLASAVLVGALLVVHSLLPWLGQVGALLGMPRAAGPVAGFLGLLLPPALVFLVFYLAYRLLPTGRVPRRPAAIGALLALLLWKTALALFGALVGHSPAFGLVTGALAGLLGFLFWIYTGVAVVLFGAEFAAVLNGDRDRRKSLA